MTTKFTIAVWQQPPSSLQKWRGRGFNTLIDLQHGADRLQTLAAAAQAGIDCIIEPDPDPIKDLARPGFFGWLQKPDEPDNQEHIPRTPAGARDFPAAIKVWTDRRAKLKSVSPVPPIYGNFNGMQVTAARDTWPTNDPSKPIEQRNAMSGDYREWSGACDIISDDWHVRNANRAPELIVPLFRKGLNRLRDWAPGKHLMTFVECCRQQRVENGPAPTASEMRAEIWAAIALGVTGICYFPAKIGGGYVADNTPLDLVTEMIAQNQLIASAEPWLMNGVRTMRTESDVELGATWRLSDGTEMTVDIRWNAVAAKWETVVVIPDQTADLRARLALAESRLESYQKWMKDAPKWDAPK